jgi:hypothetical protein
VLTGLDVAVLGGGVADEDGELPHPAAARVTNIVTGNAIQRFITAIIYTGYRDGCGLD